MSRHLIRGTSFDAGTGGVVIEYLTPAEDVRANGLVINHALLIPAEPEFEVLLEELEEAAQRALSTALEQHGQSPALEETEDDGPSPYDNPADR